VQPEVTCILRDTAVSLGRAPHPGVVYVYSAIGSLEGLSRQALGMVQVRGMSHLPDGPTEVEVSVKHGALQQIAPYVRRVLGTAPSQGSLELKAKVTAHAGMVVSETQLTSSHLAFATDEPTVIGPTGNRLVELLQDSKGLISLSFIVQGHGGQPLDWSDLAAGALREAMQQALARGIQRLLADVEERKPVEDWIQRQMESLGR
jgi:hypothetical protein